MVEKRSCSKISGRISSSAAETAALDARYILPAWNFRSIYPGLRFSGGAPLGIYPINALISAAIASRLPNGALQSLARIIQAVAKRLPGAADATTVSPLASSDPARSDPVVTVSRARASDCSSAAITCSTACRRPARSCGSYRPCASSC